ncbi:unnamed protein product [Arabis nemorensis]|uniref:Uncharacterized protein n=1 Tax=Arabis nemorensis TaxID=586526 RepID=A0A565BAS3_9BRAS|nr:unnamed protein product [Arabis nemorensis]
MAKQGMDVLLATLSKLFNLLETSGQIVGVIVLDERVNQESANLLTVGSSSRSSARSMAEVEGIPSPIIIAQVLLVRLTLTWLTGIILLIATILGLNIEPISSWNLTFLVQLAVAGVLPYVLAFDEGHASIFQREARLRYKMELQTNKRTLMNLYVVRFIFLCVSSRVSQLATFDIL